MRQVVRREFHDLVIDLKTSYGVCENIAKKRAGNFYYAFAVLPRSKRLAISAVYAFMRYCDDISDSDKACTSKIDLLQGWRTALDDALNGDYGNHDIMPAFHDAVKTFGIPPSYFHDLIDGAEMDLSIKRYQSFDDLYQYCYRVASVVGLVCIHIFGFQGEEAKKYAEYYGIAFQLTNILRDIKEDADRDRIYLPLDDIEGVGCSETDLLNGLQDDQFRDLMKLEVERARTYYRMGSPLLDLVDNTSRAGLCAMAGIYSAILDRIEEREYDVYRERVTLSTKEKLGIAARSVLFAGGDRSDAEPITK
ncbi:MAG TPA: phytoene/squalene synthase family protein [Armatimonadota bacterium]|jgi:phytoene synthase